MMEIFWSNEVDDYVFKGIKENLNFCYQLKYFSNDDILLWLVSYDLDLELMSEVCDD